MELPDEFLRYLQSSESLSGDLPEFLLWFEVWPKEQIDQRNSDYHAEEYAPGFYGFGTDGGGEMFAFGPDGGVYVLPFVGMEPKHAKRLAHSWGEFETKIVKQG